MENLKEIQAEDRLYDDSKGELLGWNYGEYSFIKQDLAKREYSVGGNSSKKFASDL